RHPFGVTLSRFVSRFAHDEVSHSRLSTGLRMSAISCAHGVFGARSTAFTHTHRISGLTSQCPSGRTPPHGPLRRVFGQFIGHVMPVECRTHWPHIWQPKTGFLTAASM